MSGKFCAQCGALLQESDKFCADCGVKREQQIKYAGLWIRVAAELIDIAIMVVGALIAIFIFAMSYALFCRISGWELHDFGQDMDLLFPIVSWGGMAVVAAYEILLVRSSWQGTVGKKMLGIKVVDGFMERVDWLRSVMRYAAKAFLPSLAGYIASYLVHIFPTRENSLSVTAAIIGVVAFLVWYLMIVFDKKKRAGHDRVVLTYVVKK